MSVDAQVDVPGHAHVHGPDPDRTTTAHGEGVTTADVRPGTELQRGEIVDRYLVIGPLGSGGGGTVYKAHDPELDRNVAIKIVRRRDEEADLNRTARALREGKAMAKLAHPNVVAVHDVGTCRAGVFIAMQLVDGVDLGQWLGESPRGEAEVLRAFVEAGRGLAAAHEADIVHGDFKPANVFVEHGAHGHVLVGDFGLARATSDEGLARAGTPLYMAPEVHDGAVADARADQFSFCLALHEALAGKHPLTGRSRHELPFAAREVPPAPGPRWLRGLLARGCSPDPAARFDSMRELVDRLEREPGRVRRRGFAVAALGVAAVAGGFAVWSVDDRPCDPAAKVSATWGSERGETVRAALVDAGGAIGADTADRVATAVDAWLARWGDAYEAICSATVVEGVQSRGLLDARMSCLEAGRLELDAQLRVLETADAEVARRAVQAIDGMPHPDACRTVTEDDAPPPELRAAVEGGRAQLAEARALERSGRFADAGVAAAPVLDVEYPGLQAEAALVVGKALTGGGAYDQAEQRLRQAHFDAEVQHHDAVAAEAAVDLVYLLGERLKRTDDALAWEPHARAAVARSGDGGRLEASLLSALGATRTTEEAYDKALALYEEALAIDRRVLGDEHLETLSTRGNIASVLDYVGRHEEADAILREVLAATEARLGPNHPEVARVVGNLAGVALNLEHDDDARALYERAVQIKRDVLGAEHPTLVTTLDGLAIAASRARDMPAALRYREEALRIAEQSLGADHPTLGGVLINHGQLQLRSGDLDAAATTLTRALTVLERAYGPDHPLVASANMSLGGVALDRGDAAAAVKHNERALQILRKAQTPGSMSLALAASNVARAYHLAGRTEEALPLYREAEPVLTKSTESRRTTFAKRLGELLVAMKDPCAAAGYLETAHQDEAAHEARAACRRRPNR